MLLYGQLPDSDANVLSPSGTIFLVVATSARTYALVPTGALNGDEIMIDNRGGVTCLVNNTGTGMGQPSATIAVIAPSFGYNFHFGSGAWYWDGQYKLSGVF